jgi:hypothetical protein
MASPLPALTSGPRSPAALPLRGTAEVRLAGPPVALALGLALALAQTVLVCLVTGSATPGDSYRALYQWDSKWYARLAEQGYPDTLPHARSDMARLGFFPGYPLATRLVARLANLTAADGSLLAAQLACWGFWTYVLLFVRRWAVPLPLAVAGAVAILVHPCAFFLVAAYSESLFLLAVLGFLYWSGVRGPVGWSLAALHGVVMTGTRIVGLPLAVCPVVLAAVALLAEKGVSPREWPRRLAPSLALAGLASLGGLLFFGFCQMQYGRWDAYMWTQRTGWGVTPDYLAVFKPEVYRVAVPSWVNGVVNPNDLSRLCVPFTVVLFGVLLLAECRAAKADGGRGWRQRLGLYLAAGLMFYIAVSGLANSYLVSMIRYTFCVHVMLALAVVHLLATARPPAGRWRPVLAGSVAGAALLSVTFQVMFVLLFTHGEWVA